MNEYLTLQLLFLMKLAAAGLCGAVIGYERKNRLKEAGIRTHMLVAIGSALIMLISQYGAAELARANGYNFDPTRIAAQIVTGIGFLGAGTIFVKKQSINGLTTAAGIWATAGIGMAMGAGMYIAGAAATFFVFVVQVLFHRDFKILKLPLTKQIVIRADCNSNVIAYIRKKFDEYNIEIVELKADKAENGIMDIELYLKIPAGFKVSILLDMLTDNDDIKLIEY